MSDIKISLFVRITRILLYKNGLWGSNGSDKTSKNGYP